MSYYTVKNISIVKNENGFNLKCKYYDSSISDWKGNRVWHDTERLYNTDYNTREELERVIFEDVLDGNLHTSSSCGKFQPLSWTNRKVDLKDEEYELIRTLESNYRKEPYGTPKHDMLYDLYKSTRYDLYYRAWQKYLKEERANKNNRFIIQANFGDYKEIFIKSKSTNRLKFTYYSDTAKVFRGNSERVVKEIARFKNMSNIKVISVDK